MSEAAQTASVLLRASALEQEPIEVSVGSAGGVWWTNSSAGERAADDAGVVVRGYAEDRRPRMMEFAERDAERVGQAFMLPKRVWGPDDRVRITTTGSYPWCVQGHLMMQFPSGATYIGSGTLVNRHHVLTAGHCLHSHNDGGWATEVVFVPGQDDGEMPFGTLSATRLLSVKGWTERHDAEWDFGMAILDDNVGDRTGWFGLITGPAGLINNYRVNVSGYPGDKGGRQLWTMADVVTGVEDERFYYRIDTFGGQSGSAVWSEWNHAPGYKAAGVHTTGEASANGATRISRVKFDRIVGWIRDF